MKNGKRTKYYRFVTDVATNAALGFSGTKIDTNNPIRQCKVGH